MPSPPIPHPFPFDPTYGYDLDALLAIAPPDAPDDLDAFWNETYARALPPELNIASRPWRGGAPDDVTVLEVEYDSWDGFRTAGWVVLPKSGTATRGMVVGHGYGGRDAPDFGMPGPRAATIFPCMRGQGRSRSPRFPELSQEHVLTGIESRDSYILRGCVVDIWRAASVLLSFAPQAADCLDYYGGSFGGGLGAMALAWDTRFRRGFLSVPTFGNHPLRVTMPCTGSGEAVRRRYLEDPGVMDVLRYYDAATIATRIRIPVYCECALFDPAVPPPGQYSVYNALGGAKKLFVARTGHFEYAYNGQETDQRRFRKELDAWFAA